MGRRPIVQKRPDQYKYKDDVECETSGEPHRVEPKVWPPRQKGDELNPTVALTCTRCGCNCMVDARTTVEDNGIEVVMPERKVKEKATA